MFAYVIGFDDLWARTDEAVAARLLSRSRRAEQVAFDNYSTGKIVQF